MDLDVNVAVQGAGFNNDNTVTLSGQFKGEKFEGNYHVVVPWPEFQEAIAKDTLGKLSKKYLYGTNEN